MVLVKPDIPPSTLTRWQLVVDLLARMTETPAVLITKAHSQDLEMFVCSESPNNPYPAHEMSPRRNGLYCEWVIENNEPLVVSDAKLDPDWHNNPDLVHNLSFYCGFPLSWPDGDVFGTLCVLDQFDNTLARQFLPWLQEFQNLLQSDLALALELEQLKAKNTALFELVKKHKIIA